MRVVLAILLAALSSACARRAVSSAPPAPSVFDTQIRNAVLAGEGDSETGILRQRLAIDPSNSDLRRRLAARYEASGSPDLALDHIRLARAAAPADESLLLEEARLLRNLRLPAQAAAALNSFLAQGRPLSAQGHSWLGIASDEAGLLAAGEKAHRAALALSPSDDALHNNLGFNLVQQARPLEAAACFELALRHNRSNVLARSNLARLLASQPGSAAVAHWTSALGAAAAHNNRAAAYLDQGDPSNARTEIAAALRFQPDYWPALQNLILASSLDHRPASVTLAPPSSLWHRFTSSLKRAFTSSPQPPLVASTQRTR